MKRRGIAGPEAFWSLFPATIGWGGVVASGEGLVEVFLPFDGAGEAERREEFRARHPAGGENEVTREAADLLARYFAGEPVLFPLPLDLSGCTEFQRLVYGVVAAIPYGRTMTYRDVAMAIGRPQAARGVGAAMAANRLPIIIPCHRVVGRGGALTGYSAPGGVASKEWLLALERGA